MHEERAWPEPHWELVGGSAELRAGEAEQPGHAAHSLSFPFCHGVTTPTTALRPSCARSAAPCLRPPPVTCATPQPGPWLTTKLIHRLSAFHSPRIAAFLAPQLISRNPPFPSRPPPSTTQCDESLSLHVHQVRTLNLKLIIALTLRALSLRGFCMRLGF
jgi:hypothetical protein